MSGEFRARVAAGLTDQQLVQWEKALKRAFIRYRAPRPLCINGAAYRRRTRRR